MGAQNKLTLPFQAAYPQRLPEINCKSLETNEDSVLNMEHCYPSVLSPQNSQRDTQQMSTYNLYLGISILNLRERVLILFIFCQQLRNMLGS